MLDSLLYEPKRRRIAMGVLLALLVLAVGFVAIGTWSGGMAVLVVFGIAFLAAAIAFVSKLLVVSHVHIRGTAGRLEALNRRYDDTARWLEAFDADTRESFLAARKAMAAADADRVQLLEKLDRLAGETPRLAAVESLRSDLDSRATNLDERLSSLAADHAESATGLRSEISEHVEQLRGELEALTAFASRLDALDEAIKAERERSDAESSRLTDEVRETLEASIKSLESEVADKLRLVNGRVSKVQDEQERKRKSAVHAVREEAVEATKQIGKRVEDSAQLSARLRGDGYVQFSRLLSADAAKTLTETDSTIQPAELKYLERKLQVIEGLCEGRLAGSVDDAVGRVLAGRLVKGKELRILEIGVLFGVGATFMHHALAPRFGRVELVLLDPFEGYYGSDHLDPLTGLPVTRAAVERNVARCGIPKDDVKLIEGFSGQEDVLAAARDAGPYNVIVIDGDHSAEGIKTDFEGYADLVKPGGFLVIDDYNSDDWPEVTRFVDETIAQDKRFKMIAVVGKTAILRRQRVSASRGSSKKSSRSASDSGDASKAKPQRAKANTKPSAAGKKTAKRASTKARDTSGPSAAPPSEGDAEGEKDPPMAVVPKKRRSTKATPAKARASSAAASDSGGSGG